MADDQGTGGGDDARHAAEHQVMSTRVERDVNADIAARAVQGTRAEGEALDRVAGGLRVKAIDELAGAARDARRSRALARVSQVLDYGFYVVYTLLAVRLVLTLIGARAASGFVRFIALVTDPFYAVFKGIVASPEAGGFTLALPIVIALAAYGLLQLGLTRLLRLIAHRRTEL